MTIFAFETKIMPEWIDYNGHMRDSYYGLVFSLAVDAMQDEIGFDAAYRERTGCTIYLLEDHKFFLREVKEGDRVRVETRLLDCDGKRFHLHMQMLAGDKIAAAGEFMELHVQQKPEPHATAIPSDILRRLQAAKIPASERHELKHRSRSIGLQGGRQAG
ncbi:thioesterase family protein [Leisingera sp. ANG59]|uniref:thioesterase family protein n=1 Tax=Leisingera sp. ANG59 TaxID=2675221 RepID=UPI0015737FCE|nr:thioesterase [Leisingera sp. ANG59]